MHASMRWADHLWSPLHYFIFCCRWRDCQEGQREFTHSLAHSLTGLIQHTRAHLALREKALSLFNPHYSRGADSIWWLSEPCGVHLLHPPTPTYLPFISSLWLQFPFFFSIFLRAQGNQKVGVLSFFDGWMWGWMDGWVDAGNTLWWTGNMILQLCRESRICASSDCQGREGKVKKGRGRRGGDLHESQSQNTSK